MLVKDLMAQPVIFVSDQATVGEALELIRKNDVRHLPVVNKRFNLLGITAENDLLRIFPRCKDEKRSFEYNLISRTPVTKVMIPNPFFVNPTSTIEEAALIMKEHKIGCLPVVEDAKLVGLISRTDVIEAFISSMGLGTAGVRITVPYQKKLGFLSELVTVADALGVIIEHMVTFDQEVVFKVSCNKAELFLKELEKLGYSTLDVIAIEDSDSAPCA